jgi:uncharacterized protein (TIGR03663 family)
VGEARTISASTGPGQGGGSALFIGLLLVALTAVGIRAPSLSERPFHTDEAVNAFILQEMFERGYTYRAHDHHGPTLYYTAGAVLGPLGLTHPAEQEEWMLRAFSCAAGVLLVLTPYLFVSYIGATAAHAAAGWLAISAPFVYYSGSFIHESLHVLLLMCFAAAFWRVHQTGSLSPAALAGALAGMAVSTKETAAPILILLGSSMLLIWFLERKRQVRAQARSSTAPHQLPWRAYVVAITVAILVVLVLFSGFGSRPARAFDLFLAVGKHVSRGMGADHAYPWTTYFDWFGNPSRIGIPWAGWLWAGFAALGYWTRRSEPLVRALALGCAAVGVLFTLLPYKTPWLAMTWLGPGALLVGAGFAAFWRRYRVWAAAVGLVGAGLMAFETVRKCYQLPVDASNPLAYSPSSMDQSRLKRDIEALASEHGGVQNFEVHVVARDYWPLPWTLRRLPKTGYWSEPPSGAKAHAVFCGPEHLAHFATAGELRPYELRPGVFIFLRPPASAP